jgi:alpha-L-fucosidase 2
MNKHCDRGRRLFVAVYIFILLRILPTYGQENPSVLWYEQPAVGSDQALPLGNGRIGAMVYGGVRDERITLNEDTLYSGEPDNVGVPRIYAYVDRAFQLIQKGQYSEAESIVRENMLGRNFQTYTTLGSLRLHFEHPDTAQSYKRTLDISQAVATVEYQSFNLRITRQIFCSLSDDVMVVHLVSMNSGGLTLHASLETPHRFGRLTPRGDDTVVFEGKLPMFSTNRSIKQIRQMKDEHKYPELFDSSGKLKHNIRETESTVYAESRDGSGMMFQTWLKARIEGGNVSADSQGLHITAADSVTLILAVDSSYNGFDRSPSSDGVDPGVKCRADLKAASAKSFEQLRTDHVERYREMFDRVSIRLGNEDRPAQPTDKWLASTPDTGNPELAALLFQFGRYLLISSSYHGTQPANLSGIWCETVHAPWNGGYTTNINAEMNYWPAEVTNLSECHDPLFTLISESAINGRKTAERSYRLPGWVTHHNVSIWRNTDPKDRDSRFSFWPMAGGWLCRHLWEHYQFSQDRYFLRERAYPLMKGAAEFLNGWLRQNERGYWVTPIATSPENAYRLSNGQRCSVSMGSTMDISIVRDLFESTIEAAEILDLDAEFRAELRQKLDGLAPFRIGRHGQLQEWYEDWDSPDDHHRHLSHLYGVFPAMLISPRSTPELAKAASKSLEMRGPGDVGWSRAWMVNLRARLRQTDLAHERLAALMHDGLNYNLMARCYGKRTYPVDLDVNFGTTAGIAEMLMQSQDGIIKALPALPEKWPNGSISGLCARGGFEVDLNWRSSKLTDMTIRSKAGRSCRIRCQVPVRVRSDGKEVESMSLAPELIQFETRPGGTYRVTPSIK